MPLTLRQIRLNCAQARQRMAQARAEKWAFGAFNLDDQATLKAVVQAAAKKVFSTNLLSKKPPL